MTQTQHTPAPSLAWRQALQTKLMAALDAAWAILEHCDDPAEIKRVRERLRAIGELAAQARKVALITPKESKADANVAAKAEVLARVMAPGLAAEALVAARAPAAAQAELSRRALEKLKGGGRARL
ncbi:hypothetical protein [Caulobacter sp. Root1472]|uniref:hypothetical protein n=1 Tax=Caulobacter sp. Root1472 TaxID=1736470 RepID=UPI0006F741E5|nr:hypothetical protein [Caulobacter sp. Root1472]KQZ30834.1 hypothetical protein ASD47_18100 [Caulobacter sp. Root1472]